MYEEFFREPKQTIMTQTTPLKIGLFERVTPTFSQLSVGTEFHDPVPRSGHACASDEYNLYVYGGYNPQGGPFQTGGARQVLAQLWVFNFARRIWSRVESQNNPQTAASCCMKLKNKKLFVYGGTSFPFGNVMSHDLNIYDLRNDSISDGSWYQFPIDESTSEFPPHAYGQSLVFHNDSMYVFGGAISLFAEPVDCLHSLNLVSAAWTEFLPVGNQPRGRYKQEIVYDQANSR